MPAPPLPIRCTLVPDLLGLLLLLLLDTRLGCLCPVVLPPSSQPAPPPPLQPPPPQLQDERLQVPPPPPAHPPPLRWGSPGLPLPRGPPPAPNQCLAALGVGPAQARPPCQLPRLPQLPLAVALPPPLVLPPLVLAERPQAPLPPAPTLKEQPPLHLPLPAPRLGPYRGPALR